MSEETEPKQPPPKKTARDALSPKQFAFAIYVSEGMNAAQAYKKAYGGKITGTTLSSAGHRLLTNTKIQAYLYELRNKAEHQALLTRDAKRKMLADIVGSHVMPSKIEPQHVIRAIEVDNVMQGDNKPQQVQVFGLSELLSMVRKKSRE